MASRSTIDPKAFRRALGNFTTGVTIITARDAAGQPVGLTANSFNSVSLEPPLVLWSLAKSAKSRAAFEQAEHWAVHILCCEQEALSNRFAKTGEDKFAGVELDEGVGGLPLLPGCSARLQCRSSFKYDGGDHLIFVGEVLDLDSHDRAPLVFHAGNYAMATRRSGPAPRRNSSGLDEDFLFFLLPRAHHQIYAKLRRVHEAQGLDDAQFFVLSSLVMQPEAEACELDRYYGLSGQRLEATTLEALAARGLITLAAPADNHLLRATAAGRELALAVLLQAKAIESDILAAFNDWEVPAFKSQLRLLADAGGADALWVWDED